MTSPNPKGVLNNAARNSAAEDSNRPSELNAAASLSPISGNHPYAGWRHRSELNMLATVADRTKLIRKPVENLPA